MPLVQRFGVTIDQCSGCGRIFLDGGKLEQLTEAEGSFYAPEPQQPGHPAQHYPAQPGYVERPCSSGFPGGLFGDGGYGDHCGSYRGGHH
ncbi:hypothetical protein A5689_15630 [Mycobacterium intracellulare subsp. yongonense]|nr:hypothetical protein A5689_15630 [Mycobacterium intracellulare subsp. yongonense]